jgi:hypothetical protein
MDYVCTRKRIFPYALHCNTVTLDMFRVRLTSDEIHIDL